MLFRNSVYPHEYMDDQEKSNETSLPEKEDFHSHLNMQDFLLLQIMRMEKEFVKMFEIKKLGEYHDL